jgi:hypothetical protein
VRLDHLLVESVKPERRCFGRELFSLRAGIEANFLLDIIGAELLDRPGKVVGASPGRASGTAPVRSRVC